MSRHMRTTVRLPDNLMLELKQEAQRRGGTVTALLEEGARQVLAQKADEHEMKLHRIPTFSSGGLLPGVDINNNAKLLDILDGLDDPT